MNKKVKIMNHNNSDDYIKLYNRWDKVVKALTKMGKKDEADYFMIKFFIFYLDPQELKKKIIIAEKMLRNGEW